MQRNVPELKIKILSFIQRNGPSLPVHISKQINENMIFAGAVLSELISNKKILISNAKIGSSPVYYLPGQEYKLSQVLYPHLKDVYKRVHDLLKEKIILKDSELEPWQRVALRESKDFAVMLTIVTGEIFWKWYLTHDEEAEKLIKKSLGLEEENKEPMEQLKEKLLDAFEKRNIPEIKAIPLEKEEVKQVEKAIEKITGIKPEKSREKKIKEEKQEILKKQLDLGDLTQFFNSKKINVLTQKQIGKKEINFTGEIKSDLGLMKVFIKFKDKKKISDSDLITAHNESGKLPLYFISTGELSKKAEKYIQDNFLIYEKFK